jgi:hypothetical protein
MKWKDEVLHPLRGPVGPRNRVELGLHFLDEYFFRTFPIRGKLHVGMNRNPSDGHVGALQEVRLVMMNVPWGELVSCVGYSGLLISLFCR